MTRVRLGVAGTGRMAAAMMGAIARVPCITVTAVASASGNADRALNFARAFGIDQGYDQLAPLIARDDIDLIYVATETRSHANVSIAALEAGKSVLCEKPFATSLAEAQAIADVARRSEGLFMEALWTLLLPAYRRVSDIVGTLAIGTPTHFTASFGYPTPAELNRGPFETNGGGVLLDRAVYPIALAVKLMGPVAQIEAAIARNANEIDLEASLQLVHESGGHSQLAASLSTLLSNTAVISGTGGSVSLEAPLLGSEQITIRRAKNGRPAGNTEPGPLSMKQRLKEELRSTPALRRLHRTFADGQREHHHYGANQYLPMLAHVVGLAGAGKKESDVVPLDLSLEVTRVIDLARAVTMKTQDDEVEIKA